MCFTYLLYCHFCEKLELYDAPNSPRVHLKVSNYHRCFYKKKLQMTERGFSLRLNFSSCLCECYQFLHPLSCIFFAPIDSSRLYFSHCHSFVKICFTHQLTSYYTCTYVHCKILCHTFFRI